MAAIDPNLRISSVALGVSDLSRSADFYERALGLAVIERSEDRALLGADAAAPALELNQIPAPTPLEVRASGLYHVAWLHPSRAALAETVRRIAGSGWPLEGASDHGVSEALYLSDPDGLGIEIYVDRPRERWERPPGGRGVRMVTLPLDLEDLLAQSSAAPPPAIAEGTAVGHVHLKVANVERSSAFYRDALGFEEQAALPSAAFLAAGGYHHHVGLNSWQSEGADATPASAPGLQRVEFALAGDGALESLAGQLAERGVEVERNGAVSVRDPDGQLLAFVPV